MVVGVLIIIYNTMLKKKNKVKTAFSSLDVMLKKRYDLILQGRSYRFKKIANYVKMLYNIINIRRYSEV